MEEEHLRQIVFQPKIWMNKNKKGLDEWYFSVVDVVEVLTESTNPRDYWFKMKLRVKT